MLLMHVRHLFFFSSLYYFFLKKKKDYHGIIDASTLQEANSDYATCADDIKKKGNKNK